MSPRTRPLAALLVAAVAALPAGARAGDGAAEPQADAPTKASAPAEAAPTYETVVTSDPYGSGGTSVRQIRRADIEARGGADLARVLELEASLNASTGARGERIVTLRGFDQRQTAVLIDGAPLFVPYDGQLDLSRLPAAMIARVTLARSPGVAAGPSGLGGAISVVSRRPGQGPAIEARLEGSLPLHGRAELSHSAQSGALGYSLFAGGEHSEGFALPSGFAPTALQGEGLRVGSDRRGYHLGATVRYAPEGAHEASASALWTDSSRGIPPSTEARPARFWRFTTWRGLMLQASHRFSGAAQVETTAYARLYDNLVDAYDDASFSTQLSPSAFHSWYHDRAFGLRTRPRLSLDAPWGRTHLSAWAGAEYDRHTDEEETAYQRVLLMAAPEASARLAAPLTATLACQVEAELPVDLPGEDSRPAVGVGPLASLHLELTEALGLGATAARRHRFPTLRERFSRANGYQLLNPDLQPEAAWHFDAEIAWRAADWLSLEASLFDAEVEDLIEQVAVGGGMTRIENVGRARLAGAELSARLRPLPHLRLDASYAFLHARRLDADEDHLEYRPAHKLTAGVIALPHSRVEISSFVRVVGPQSFRNPNTGAWGRLGAYAVWDAQLKVRALPFATLLARATNLLDASYQTEFGYPDPGRQIWLGLEAGWPGEEG
ncbi:MAG: TonB-dependent receptor [Myxococcales bacterium]|jgi:iron complex outermembrane receptor protein